MWAGRPSPSLPSLRRRRRQLRQTSAPGRLQTAVGTCLRQEWPIWWWGAGRIRTNRLHEERRWNWHVTGGVRVTCGATLGEWCFVLAFGRMLNSCNAMRQNHSLNEDLPPCATPAAGERRGEVGRGGERRGEVGGGIQRRSNASCPTQRQKGKNAIAAQT